MRRFVCRLPLALALSLALAPRLAADGVPAPGPYVWKAADGRTVAASFGFVAVPEDRTAPGSQTLELAYVRLPATTAKPGSPIVYLAGGPGASGIDTARGPRADLLLALRAVADVVLLDQRGTGWSKPALVCGKSWRHATEEPLDEAEAIAEIEAAARVCAADLGRRGVRLAAYNPREIADDVEALRQALGVARVSLLATSFGTRLALEAMRRHPASVDRVALLGVVGPDQELKLPRVADELLAGLEVAPGRSVRDSLAGRLAALAKNPVELAVEDVLTGDEVPLRVGPLDLRLAIADHLGSADRLLALREIAAELERGKWRAIEHGLLRQRKRWLGQAMSYAVACTAGASEARQRQVAEEAASSLVGRQLDFGFPEVCAALGLEPLGHELREPVRSPAPVLIVSGTLDPRTPVANGEEVAKTLPNAKHLVVAGAGHGDDLLVASPEIARVAATFFAGGTVTPQRLVALPPHERPRWPPGSEVKTVVETLHGVVVPDDYRWLEDSRTPEVRVWAEAQNSHSDRVLKVLPGRLEMRRRLEELSAAAGGGLPTRRGSRTFVRASTGSATLPAIVVREAGAKDRVLVDPRQLSDGQGRAAVELLDVAPDGEWVAFGVRRDGAEEKAVRFVRVADGAMAPDELPVGRYFGVALAADGQGAYYARERDDGEGARLHYHRFGTEAAEDAIVFGEAYRRGSIVWGNLSDDGRWLVHHAIAGNRPQIDVFLDRLDPGPAGNGAHPRTGHELATRREVVSGVNAAFYAGVAGDLLVIHTTWQAPRGRVLVAPLATPSREHWREIVPEHRSAVIAKVYAAGGRLLVETLENVHSRLHVFDLEGRALGEVPLPGPGAIGGFAGRFDDPVVDFTFSSFHLPTTSYRYDLAAGKLLPGRETGLETGLEGGAFEAKQLWFTSKDGTRVPAFVMHRQGLALDGSHPTIVNAYGGFATSLTPSYQPQAAWWVDQGGVYVVANVRGGGEFGEAWHEAAMREHKQRSIDDLVAVAEGLVEAGYTRPGRLATWGHSNGGLLVAAAMVARPELFRAVVSTHPLLDMLRYNRFLAARFWLVEYGSPERADAFGWLRAYSPYQNVRPGVRYPAVFLETSFADTQVHPLHARKMAARLQAVAPPERPVLLRHHQDVGHGGEGVSADERLDELVDVLSFLHWQLGGE